MVEPQLPPQWSYLTKILQVIQKTVQPRITTVQRDKYQRWIFRVRELTVAAAGISTEGIPGMYVNQQQWRWEGGKDLQTWCPDDILKDGGDFLPV